ncbi:DALR anticodon-binding domain-containing protein 3-like [Mya arenaria]|nr:DALR anticodon-binding domain-containing protein 3-like [Mya arenaria]XP_052779469.1 DALR anticodon-binding domain-containing protein 3-like [Mya arenaria]
MREDGTYVSTGSFVMYNCARLIMLFAHFQQAVDNGTFPPLPELEKIDFSTLREEQEWSLLLTYVFTFPDLVQQTIQNMEPSDTTTLNIHTHKMCQMLGSLSRCLSSYYSRYHVLGEARPHLYPQMFARLYLLKAVHQVLVNGLQLIAVSPLSQV